MRPALLLTVLAGVLLVSSINAPSLEATRSVDVSSTV